MYQRHIDPAVLVIQQHTCVKYSLSKYIYIYIHMCCRICLHGSANGLRLVLTGTIDLLASYITLDLEGRVLLALTRFIIATVGL